MGQKNSKEKEVDISLDHPKFKNAKLLSGDGQRVMQTTVGIDEKDYNSWKDSLKDRLPNNDSFLFFPKQQAFSAKGLCGSSGTATVHHPSFSYPMMISLISSAVKSKIGKVVAKDLKNPNFGICSTH